MPEKIPVVKGSPEGPKGPENCINSTLGGTTWNQFHINIYVPQSTECPRQKKYPLQKARQKGTKCGLKSHDM